MQRYSEMEKFKDFKEHIRALEDPELKKARASLRKRYYSTLHQNPDEDENVNTVFLDFALAFALVNYEIAKRNDSTKEEKIQFRQEIEKNLELINRLPQCGGVTSEHLTELTTPLPKRPKRK